MDFLAEIENARLNVARKLVADKSDYAFEKNQFGSSPLHYAAGDGHPKVCEFLLKKGAIIDEVDTCGMTPLHHAAAQGHSNACELLLQKGANPNVEDKNGNSPLHYAILYGVEMCKLFFDHGANIHARNKRGVSILHDAIFYFGPCQLETCKWLIENKADINTMDIQGESALMSAKKHGFTKVRDLLISRGAK